MSGRSALEECRKASGRPYVYWSVGLRMAVLPGRGELLIGRGVATECIDSMIGEQSQPWASPRYREQNLHGAPPRWFGDDTRMG